MGANSLPKYSGSVTNVKGQRIPLLAKEGWPRHEEEVPVPKRRGRGGRSEIILRNAF